MRYNRLRLRNRKIFNKWDQQHDLDYQLMLGMNFVPFNANLIIDYKAKDLSEPYVYPPHMPLEILLNQSMMNMSTKNATELNTIF